jgi:hypothetical protein
MPDTSPSQIAKWPLPIGAVSFVDGLLFGLATVRPQTFETSTLSALINVLIALCFSGGAIGVFLRKPWGISSLLCGSYIQLASQVYMLVTIFVFMGGVPPIFALLAIMVMSSLYSVWPVWPVFLVIWLRRTSVKQYLEQHWSQSAI